MGNQTFYWAWLDLKIQIDRVRVATKVDLTETMSVAGPRDCGSAHPSATQDRR